MKKQLLPKLLMFILALIFSYPMVATPSTAALQEKQVVNQTKKTRLQKWIQKRLAKKAKQGLTEEKIKKRAKLALIFGISAMGLFILGLMVAFFYWIWLINSSWTYCYTRGCFFDNDFIFHQWA